jgi:hypothetical protein
LIELQAFEELAAKHRQQLARAGHAERCQPRLQRALHFARVHVAVRKFEPDAVVVLPDALGADHGAQLAQVPAQFGARIRRVFPQQVAQALPLDRPRRQRQEGEQGARLARGGQVDGATVARNGQHPEHLEPQCHGPAF